MKTTRTITLLLAFLMIAGSGLMAGCIPDGVKGDGDVVKEKREVSGFTSLEISSAFNVFLTQGRSESLTVEADKNLMEHIITEIKGDKLMIHTSKKGISKSTKMNIYLTFEQLEMIDVSGAVEVTGEGPMTFEELTFDGSGASEISMELTAEVLTADFSGASEIELIGSAKAAYFDLSGASEIDAYDFEIIHCELDVSGASEVKINVSKSLEVDISGAASVKYKGNPSVKSDVSGAASLRSY